MYGLRTSWETERDNTLRGLKWTHEETEYRLLPCQGSPCLWTVVPIRAGEDSSIKTFKRSSLNFFITYVDDLLLTGWQHHIDAITKALQRRGVMSGTSEGIDFLGARITRDADGTVWCGLSTFNIVLERMDSK